MIVFKTSIARINADRVVLTLRADGEPIGQLLLSPRVCRALMLRLFDDEEETDHVILEPNDAENRLP